MDWTIILRESLWMGLAFSAVMTVFVVVGLLWNKEVWYDDYPPDVKARYGPMSEKAKKQRSFYVVALLLVIVGFMAFVVVRMTSVLGTAPSFLVVFASVAIVFSIFNLYDAFIIDWLMLMKLWPSLGVLPGTEGMAGYSDMKLWTQNLFKGVIIAPVVGLIAAGITMLVMWIGTLI